jgi:dipeptidyl aminopeptidase/acylaminoacyl peptidase/uncharacterized protein (DUF885 family)
MIRLGPRFDRRFRKFIAGPAQAVAHRRGPWAPKSNIAGHFGSLIFVLLTAAPLAAGADALDRDPTLSPMRSFIEHESADLARLRRRYDLPASDDLGKRLKRFYDDELAKLQAVDFDSLDQGGRVDYLLMHDKLAFSLKQVEVQRRQLEEIAGLRPIADAILGLEEARHEVRRIDPEQAAKTLHDLAAQVAQNRAAMERALPTSPATPHQCVLANREADLLDRLRDVLREWDEFYIGYDPAFTWWMREAYPVADTSLKEYAGFLRERFAGTVPGQDGLVIGDPIGREALLDSLALERVPYTPEELIDLAEHEFAWCQGEMTRAAADLGCGGDWHKALDKAAGQHVKPGEQPQLIKALAEEATKFVEDRDLVTIPPLCKETWRIEMMSPQRQKVNPYFTGGEVISVSFPTDDMSFEDKLMSMRGNNPAFCRATVFHELIPGHCLQGFMAERYNAHRREFSTPFYVEGWALYWEMRMWEMGFPRTPEERVGMLFWRAHRCARIIFSLKFHLGQMTAQQAIDFLVDRVGHERRNATAEVRRSVNGSYPPLYQAAYLLGGLQLRSLRDEMVTCGKMTERQFHDAVLRENAIPIDLVRAELTGQKLTRDFKPSWRFYDAEKRELPPLGVSSGGASGPPPQSPQPSPGLPGEGVRTSATQPSEASRLRRDVAGNPRVYRDHVDAHWFAGGSRFWYRNDLPENKREFVLVDAETGIKQPAFDHSRVAAALARSGVDRADAQRLPIDLIEFVDGGKGLRLIGADKSWLLNLDDYSIKAQVESADGPLEARLKPTLRPHPSREQGSATRVTFVNHSADAVTLFWIDAHGDREPYGGLAPGERRVQQTFGGHVWLVTRSDGTILAVFEARNDPAEAIIDAAGPATRESIAPPPPRVGGRPVPKQGPAEAGVTSPDGRWIAFVQDEDLWLRDAQTREAHALTHDGTAADTWHRDVLRDQAIGMEYDKPDAPPTEPDVYWSPDSRRLVAMRTHTAPKREVFLVQSSPKDQLQPKLLSYPYLKAGDEVPVSKPHLFDVAAAAEVPVNDTLFPTPWSIDEVRWAADSSRFTFLYNQRGHQVLRIVAVDAASGKAGALVEEHSDTFIDYSGKGSHDYLDDSAEVLWMSERDGWNHLYLYDAKTGQLKDQVTRGQWVVRDVDRVDAARRQIWFRAGGIRPGQDPYFIHYCRVNFDGTGLVVLTEGDGNHSIRYSPDQRFFLDTWSRVDSPPVTELRRAEDGKLLCKLEQADASEVLALRRRFPEPFVAPGRDGKTDIFGVIYRPAGFDPSRKYPVIEEIYAGPQDSYVPKSFRATFGLQRMADRGFILVQIDGMGTSNRSKKFHDVCWKDLADAGFPDRIAWMKAAAEKHPEMDLSRVGVFGGSAGGQNALGALLFHGDFYKVAVADCGCHDNRMDKIWWNEQWMGWPLGPEYARNSNVANAYKLTGKLLLFVSELDHNVDPASTMQVVNALEKANKDFDLVVMTNADHGGAESPYGSRRRMEFFVKNLLGSEPN